MGVNSTGGLTLPPFHFDFVRVDPKNPIAGAHAFETEEFGFIVMTEPMVDEMRRLSSSLVERNRALMHLQIAPAASALEIAQLLLFIQFCFVASHEYSHLVRRHLDDDQPLATEIGESLFQTQELEADGYAIYHLLEHFFHGGGRQAISQTLRIGSEAALENSILSCFLLSTMVQFCARWAGKVQVESDVRKEHPPLPVRIDYSILFVEMWCREVGGISTSWMTDGTLKEYFAVAARLFAAEMKTSWDAQMSWLRSPQSEQYRAEIQRGLDRLRKTKLKPMRDHAAPVPVSTRLYPSA
jgi:hypothetical protein